MIRRTFSVLLLAAGFAAAQQGAVEEAVRKQVAEVSRLMRESERLLLEITRVDRLVETQKQVEEEIKKLLPPEQPGQGGAGEEERAKQRERLEAKQKEISQRLEDMLRGEREKGDLAAQQLEELLKNLPRQQQPQSSPDGSGEPQSAEEQKRLRDREEEERKQHQPQMPRQQRDEPKDRQSRRTDKQRPPDDPAAARRERAQAWIAKLPPEEAERINRNDFSRVPLRYRRLIEEYTAQRAKHEVEAEPDANR